MIKTAFIVLFGVLTGVITGLVPGIHPNTVIFSSLAFYFSLGIDLLSYMAFIAGLSVSHTFHDFIPSIFLGAPESSTALASLPGRRMAEKGLGKVAFLYTVEGGIISVAALLVVSPLLFIALDSVYSLASPLMQYILLFFLLVPVFGSDNPFSALKIAGISGLLGLVVFSIPINQEYALMPVFTGLFAVPALLSQAMVQGDLPEQVDVEDIGYEGVKGGFMGFIAGIAAGILPGIGGAISTYILSPFISGEKEFLAAMGAVNTTDILMSFLTLMVLGKARSGSAIALQALSSASLPQLGFVAGASLLATGISVPLALKVSSDRVTGALDYSMLSKIVLVIVVLVSYYLTGILGVAVLVVSSLVGTAAASRSQRRMCMAVLIVPSILFFAGIDIFI